MFSKETQKLLSVFNFIMGLFLFGLGFFAINDGTLTSFLGASITILGAASYYENTRPEKSSQKTLNDFIFMPPIS